MVRACVLAVGLPCLLVKRFFYGIFRTFSGRLLAIELAQAASRRPFTSHNITYVKKSRREKDSFRKTANSCRILKPFFLGWGGIAYI